MYCYHFYGFTQLYIALFHCTILFLLNSHVYSFVQTFTDVMSELEFDEVEACEFVSVFGRISFVYISDVWR